MAEKLLAMHKTVSEARKISWEDFGKGTFFKEKKIIKEFENHVKYFCKCVGQYSQKSFQKI